MSQNIATMLQQLEADFQVTAYAATQLAPEEERQLNDQIALPQNAEPAHCARIRYGEPCGIVGKMAYVVNSYNNQPVKAKIRVRWVRFVVGGGQGEFDIVVTLAPGSEKALGCTRSHKLPLTIYNYSVIDCVCG